MLRNIIASADWYAPLSPKISCARETHFASIYHKSHGNRNDCVPQSIHISSSVVSDVCVFERHDCFGFFFRLPKVRIRSKQKNPVSLHHYRRTRRSQEKTVPEAGAFAAYHARSPLSFLFR